MMDKKIKQEWVAALRSGRYRQGTGRLRSSDDHYCCLGVLCDITPGIRWARRGDQWIAHCEDESPSWLWASTTLPATLARSLGVMDKEAVLMDLNDYKLRTFSEIADWIEENL